MIPTDRLKQQVVAAIDRRRDRIIGLGEAIMDEPELGFKEMRTARKIAAVFSELGLPVREGLALTGVKAVLKGGRPGPTLALLGELDAVVVPDHPRADARTGAAHACGHNAQIAGLAGAAIGLVESGAAAHLAGDVVFFAVPAEEYVEIEYRLRLVEEGKATFLGGKPELVQLGHFDGIDMATMVHAASADSVEGAAGISGSSNGFLAKSIRFVGQAAHAGMAPEKGINALNAANLALAAIHAHRETFRDQDCVRVHPIITKGGDLVNIVPAEVCLETYVRARTTEAMLDAASKVDRAVRGAALAIGCKAQIRTVPGFLPLRNDPLLAEAFRATVCSLFGPDSCREYPHSGGSTDAGDLSHLMPVLHPNMTGGRGQVHCPDWHIADPDAGYVAPAKVLAMMAIDLLGDGAELGRRVVAESRPAMSKEEYLLHQKELFRCEVFDGRQS